MANPTRHLPVPSRVPCNSIVGYCAHWRESLADPDTKIIRPQQDYKGVWLRHYADVNARTAEGEREAEGRRDGVLAACDSGHRVRAVWRSHYAHVNAHIADNEHAAESVGPYDPGAIR